MKGRAGRRASYRTGCRAVIKQTVGRNVGQAVALAKNEAVTPTEYESRQAEQAAGNNQGQATATTLEQARPGQARPIGRPGVANPEDRLKPQH